MPQNYVASLHLIGMSLQNVLAFAKVFNGGDRLASQLAYPLDESLFEVPWKISPTITSFSFNKNLEFKQINPLTKDEILRLYSSYTKKSSNDVSDEDRIAALS